MFLCISRVLRIFFLFRNIIKCALIKLCSFQSSFIVQMKSKGIEEEVMQIQIKSKVREEEVINEYEEYNPSKGSYRSPEKDHIRFIDDDPSDSL